MELDLLEKKNAVLRDQNDELKDKLAEKEAEADQFKEKVSTQEQALAKYKSQLAEVCFFTRFCTSCCLLLSGFPCS